MTINEIQDAFRFDMDMILFDPFSGESESEEWYLERNKRNHNDMNVICYLANKEAIDLLEELKELRKFKDGFYDLGKLYSEIRQEERNKAIDELLIKLNDELEIFYDNDRWSSNNDAMWKIDEIKKIAEQLKGGGE